MPIFEIDISPLCKNSPQKLHTRKNMHVQVSTAILISSVEFYIFQHTFGRAAHNSVRTFQDIILTSVTPKIHRSGMW